MGAELAKIAVMKRERRTTDRDRGLKWALAVGVVFVVLATVGDDRSVRRRPGHVREGHVVIAGASGCRRRWQRSPAPNAVKTLSDDNVHDAMLPEPRPVADAQDAGRDDRSGMATPAAGRLQPMASCA